MLCQIWVFKGENSDFVVEICRKKSILCQHLGLKAQNWSKMSILCQIWVFKGENSDFIVEICRKKSILCQNLGLKAQNWSKMSIWCQHLGLKGQNCYLLVKICTKNVYFVKIWVEKSKFVRKCQFCVKFGFLKVKILIL